MSFAIKSETGFVDSDGIIAYPKVSITAKGASLGSFVKAGSVLWKRNSEFSTAEVELCDKRISSTNMLGGGFKVGTEIEIHVSTTAKTSSIADLLEEVVGGEIIFTGYVMSQSMRVSGGTDNKKDESIILKCVDYKYDLYREVIIGQIGLQADSTDGKEMSAGGIYGGGAGWFSGLPCVFNDRTFAKNAESAWSHATSKTQFGNGRKVGSAGVLPPYGVDVIFDGDYFALNLKGKDDKIIGIDSRNIAWSAWDMLKYVVAFCGKPPWSIDDVMAKAGKGDTGKISLEAVVSTKRIILGSANGMDKVYPEGVDVQGMRGSDAITKICSSCGFSWWLEPGFSASVLHVWRTGLSLSSKMIFLGSGGTGVPSGLYNTLISGTLEYPLVNTEKWNINDLEIDIDYTQVIGSLIGTTDRIRIQNIFPLRKGWTNDIWLSLLSKATKVGAVLPIAGAFNKEAHEIPLLTGTAGKSVRYFLEKISNNHIKMLISNTDSDEGILAKEADSFHSIFRRWITDETGTITATDDSKRDPYRYGTLGLVKTNGSTYMVKPREFMARNFATSRSGDTTPPRTYFCKFSSTQTGQKVSKTEGTSKLETGGKPGEYGIDNIKIIKEGGGEFYPFGQKKGNARIMTDRGGVFLEDGDLKMSCLAYDKSGSTAYLFSPIVLGCVEHDQARLAIITKLFFAGAGGIAAGRRWIDGKRFSCKRAYAVDSTKYKSPEQIKDGGAAAEISTEGKELKDWTIDEKDKLVDEMEASADYYKSPIVSMRATIPTITTAYLLGHSISGIEGRLDFTADSPGPCCIVGVNFDLRALNTIISVESEKMDPKFGFEVGSQPAKDNRRKYR